MQHKYLPAHHRYLSQQEIKPILKNYAKHAYEAIMESRDKFAGASTPLIPFIIPVAYKANAYAFFGRSFPAEESYEPFKSFDSVFHLKLAGVPEIFLQKSVRDWYKVHELIKDYLKTPHEDAIALVHILEQDAEALGYVRLLLAIDRRIKLTLVMTDRSGHCVISEHRPLGSSS